MQEIYEELLTEKRGFITKWPNDAVVMIVSGGLDSIITSAKIIKEKGLTVYPLHIERGQTNFTAERQSIEKYESVFEELYPGKFKPTTYIKLNVPPTEIKSALLEYTKQHGHPLRDTMLQMAAVQFAASLRAEGVNVKTIFCAVMPEDYFPHSKLESIRATNIAVCQNMDDWEWQITSPNIDLQLEEKLVSKSDEIRWAADNNFPSEFTVSCNVAAEDTQFLNCGTCSSCERRKSAFDNAGVEDLTVYASDTNA